MNQWASTPTTVSLSNGEAESGGIEEGVGNALRFTSMAAGLGIDVDLRVHSDYSAAVGIPRRRCHSKITYISVGYVWVRKRPRNNEFVLEHASGPENPADLLQSDSLQHACHPEPRIQTRSRPICPKQRCRNPREPLHEKLPEPKATTWTNNARRQLVRSPKFCWLWNRTTRPSRAFICFMPLRVRLGLRVVQEDNASTSLTVIAHNP